MRKLVVLLCVLSLFCTQAFAYTATPYTSPDGIPMVEVVLDDGTTELMTQGQFEEWEAAQERLSSQSVPAVDLSNVAAAAEIFYDADLVDNGIPYASDLQGDLLAQLPTGFSVLSDPEEGTMKYVVQSIFGKYEPLQQEVTVYLDDGTAVSGRQVVEGIAGVDWTFIAGVALFAIVLYAFLRLLGVILHV